MKAKKPLGHKNYGSIPHLPGSRKGPGDHGCNEGQAKIATIAPRDKNDLIIVQEKLDGSNVGVARIDDKLIPLGRAGYPAITSRWEQHKHFHNWVYSHYDRFMNVLKNGERLVGEWLMQAHGTRYRLGVHSPDYHSPFVPFDLMVGHTRLPYGVFWHRVAPLFQIPACLRYGDKAMSIEEAMESLGEFGHHGAMDPAEGAVWRVERKKPTGKKGEKVHVVDFLVKYVRPDKVDGKYLPEISGEEAIWNWMPKR